MKVRWILAAMCMFVLAAFVTVHAEDKATTKKAESGLKIRLVQPWSKMTDLSDDQKEKIKEIHSKALDDIRVITDKENTDIMATLSDDQKTEARKIMAESKSSGRKAKSDASKSDGSKKDDSAK